MFFPIQQIKIPNESHHCLDFNGEIADSIDYLSKINIFVGETILEKAYFYVICYQKKLIIYRNQIFLLP